MTVVTPYIDYSERFWSKVDVAASIEECWPWKAGRFEKGYGSFSLTPGFLVKRSVRAHRVAYELTRGSIPVGMIVMHKCDNPPCCNPNHLVLGTVKENAEDRDRKNRGVRGNLVPTTKLSPQAVLEIRDSKGSHRKLAKKYGVSKASIYYIKKRINWSHL